MRISVKYGKISDDLEMLNILVLINFMCFWCSLIMNLLRMGKNEINSDI